jgi:hypothetical protein
MIRGQLAARQCVTAHFISTVPSHWTGRSGARSVGLVEYTRQQVVALLRKAGLFEVADKAMQDLPDPVDLDYAQEWGMRHGVSRDLLIDRMGGSS